MVAVADDFFEWLGFDIGKIDFLIDAGILNHVFEKL